MIFGRKQTEELKTDQAPAKQEPKEKRTFREKWQARKERRQRILEERSQSRFARKMKPVYNVMNRFSVLFTILLAVMINLIIEILSRHSAIQAFRYLTGSPLVFLYNTYLITVTLCLAYIFKRRTFVRALVSIVWLLIGLINGALLLKRVTPFNAQDLKAVSEAAAVATRYFSVFELVLVIAGLAAVVVWLISFWRRGMQYQGKVRRVAAIIVCAALFVSVPFVTKLATRKRVLSSYFGNIAFAYQDYGLPYCFMTSLFNTGIDQPEGYSQEAIARINPDHSLNRIEVDRDKKDLPNIILIQWESFFDTDEVSWIKPSIDPMPNFHKWEKEYTCGYFKAPSVGAGTANTEFEVLTGLNMRSFGPGEYPFKTILKETTCESAASALDQVGYKSFAFHNNGGNFYSRADVYNNIGFDCYVSKEFMNILQYTENGWSKDLVLPQYLKQAMNSTSGADFLFTVTVQGHGDYPSEKVLQNPAVTLADMDDELLKNKWEYYVNQMYETDLVLGDLIKDLEKRGEPTVVFIYGDHLPTMGLTEEDLDSRYLYNTNFVMWDNIGLGKKDTNLAAYQVVSEIMKRVGIRSGTVFNYHQTRRGTKHYLEDLELLQYDILYGEHYAYEDKTLPIAEGHLEMGLKDVEIKSLQRQSGETFSIYGEGFNQNSSIYINDEKQKTVFLNNTRLDFSEWTPVEGDEVRVCQVGSKSRIFRSSRTYLYHDGVLIPKPEQDEETEEGEK
ncbi:MAG: sulfatase-like hydrolase/transferase [Lachnospiraceae bacterium]|nr:sulfatase-like hydrolase/transferase [Lachnospiraceae bacterium]